MKSSSIRHLFAIAVLLAVSAAPLPAADATYGNLTVTGTADFGTWSEGDNGPGLTLNYTDGATAAVNFIGSGSAVIWQWGNFNGSQNANSMTLDQNNQLLLYSGTTAGITLNPSGASAFAGSVTISGTDNELPNQVLISGSSILTQGLADGRYLSLSAASSYVTQTAANANYVQSVNFAVGIKRSGTIVGPHIALTGGTATGPYSFAGIGAIASGLGSTAITYSSTASGYNSAAFGEYSNASGADAVAIGVGSTASAFYSVAIGNLATASGEVSAATAYNSTASGDYSIASGYYSSASGYGALASGDGSLASGVGSVASGDGSVASGNGSTANGDYSTDSGYVSTANADFSTASGGWAYAGGFASIATGFHSTANGDYSIANGEWSTTDGDWSTAAGNTTTAAGYAQFVIGQWNLSQGDPNNWVATDDLLEIGNGVDGDHPGNAFVVKKNGDTTVSGALLVSGTTGNVNTISNGGLVVTGTAVPVVLASGTVTTVVSTGSNSLVLIPQQGDVSMGAFVAGAQPQ